MPVIRHWMLAAIAGFAVTTGTQRTVAAEGSLGETRTAIEKWVEARQLVSKVRSDWRTDRETLEQSIQLYERELKGIEEQMAKVSTNNTQIDKERAEAESIKLASGAALERAREFGADFQPKVLAMVPKLPPPLQELLKPLLNRLPTDASTRMTAAERMQVLVGILGELDKFNNAVSVFNEKRKDSAGNEVSVETVYVGLGAAYFVNPSNDFAGTGTPGDSGWQWTPRPELAAAVRDVVRIYRNEQPARFIPLPAVVR